MLRTIHVSPGARRSARHQVELPCEVIGRHDEIPRLMWATDLSDRGIWLQTTRPLDIGEELVVCFRPAAWWRRGEVVAFGEVARASGGRRVGDDTGGMGVALLDLTTDERFALRSWLRPRAFVEPQRRATARERRRGLRCLPPLHPFAARLD